MEPRLCVVCQKDISGMRVDAKYCGKACREKVKRASRAKEPNGTSRTYAYVNNNWHRYFAKLLRTKRYHYRDTEVEVSITPEDLIELLKEQNYRCALSGMPLSCRMVSGVVYHTNGSIDRINAGGPYSKDNVQIVAAALNNFRTNLSVEEFIGWCSAVAEFHTKH